MAGGCACFASRLTPAQAGQARQPIGAGFTPNRRHCFRQFSGAVCRKIESRFIRFCSVLLKSVKLIHFLTKLKCFVLPAESLVTLFGPLSSQNELMDPLDCSKCFSCSPPTRRPPFLSDTVNLSQFQSLIIITPPPSTVHLLLPQF